MWQRWGVGEQRPWLTPVGFALVGLVIAANAAGDVGLGTSGDALVVTVGVALYVVTAMLFLLWVDAPVPVTVALLLGMAGSSALIHHGDPTSSGGIGLYLGMAFAPLRLDVRTAAIVSAVGVLIFDLVLAIDVPNQVVFILVVTGGAAFFFFLGTLLRREQEQRRHVAQLLAELEASREAEKNAVMLAERTRLAREMHDVLAHTLSGLVLQLDGARLLSKAHGAEPEVDQAIARAHGLARTGLQEARQAITTLRGGTMPGPELIPALVDEQERITGRGCSYRVCGEARPLSAEARLALYRTAQEALSNVRKHAQGADVEVRLSWTEHDVRLSIEDTGGADPTLGTGGNGSGYGLAGMVERAELLGGRFESRRHGSGYRVVLALPIGADA